MLLLTPVSSHHLTVLVPPCLLPLTPFTLVSLLLTLDSSGLLSPLAQMYSPPQRGYHVPSSLRSTLAAEPYPSPPSRSSSPPSPSPRRESSSINLAYLVPRSSAASSPAHSPPARSASARTDRTDYTASSSAASSYSNSSAPSSPEMTQRQARAGAPSPTPTVGMIAFPTPRTRPELRVDTRVQPSPPRRVPGQGGTQHSRVRGSSMSVVPSPLRQATQPTRQFARSVSASHAPAHVHVDSPRPTVIPLPRPRSPTMPRTQEPVANPTELEELLKSAEFRADILPHACPELTQFVSCDLSDDAPFCSPVKTSKRIEDKNVMVLSFAITFADVELVAVPVKEYSSPLSATLSSPGSLQGACAEQLQTPMTPNNTALGLTFVAGAKSDFSRLDDFTVSPETQRHTRKQHGRRVACAAVMYTSLNDEDLDHIDRCWKSLSLGFAAPPDTSGLSTNAAAAADASYDKIVRIVTEVGRAAKKLGCTVHVSNMKRTFQVRWDGSTQLYAAVSETFGRRRDGTAVRAGQDYGLCEMMAATAWARMQVGIAC